MSFEKFKERISSFVRKSNENLSEADQINVRFYEDENGKLVAECSDGTVFTGNRASLKLAVLWGSGHQATI